LAPRERARQQQGLAPHTTTAVQMTLNAAERRENVAGACEGVDRCVRYADHHYR
jgi:hypothetical protein